MDINLILLIVCTSILCFFLLCSIITIIVLAVQVRKMKKAMKPIKKITEWMSAKGKELITKFIEYKLKKTKHK